MSGFSSLFSTYRGLKPGVYVLFAARVINRIGDFVQLFLVLYLTGRMGFSEAAAGRFVMLTAVMNGLGVLAGGFFSDRFNRKVVLVFCQLSFGLFYLACGFYTDSMVSAWLIFLSSVFRGATWPATSAMVIDLTEGEDRTKAFSLLYLGTNIGVALGPIIAGILYTSYLNWLFWSDALTTFLSASAVLLFVPDTKPSESEVKRFSADRNDGERAEEGNALRAFLQRPVLVIYLAVAILASYIYAQHSFSLPLQLEDLFALSGARLYGYIMTFNAVTVLLFTALITRVTRRLRPITNITIASGFYLVGFGSILFVSRFSVFLAVTFIWTIGEVLMVTNSTVFVARHSPIRPRGRFMSIVSLIQGAGYAICPWVAGMIIESFGIRSIWVSVIIVGSVSSISFLLLWRYLREREEYVPTAEAL